MSQRLLNILGMDTSGQGRVGVAQIGPAYIVYTSTLEQRFKAPIYYVLGVQGVPFEDANSTP